jgi:cation:H+ antiporter
MPWVTFALSAVVIVIAGTKLSQYGDQIAEQTGLGELWIGVVLIASATSLPELLTDLSAVWISAPDLAVGDLLGSNMANMLILGIIDLLSPQKQVWRQTAYEHTLSATVAMTLTGLAALFILYRTEVALWGVGADSLTIALIYLMGMRAVYRNEDMRRRQQQREKVVRAAQDEPPRRPTGLKRASLGFALATLTIIVAAPLLAVSAKEIVERTGIAATFVGASFVAGATSLPELATSLAAVRLGAFDLAVGNLFGSNAFNMCALFFTDIAYRPGPLLSAVSQVHAITALVSILLMNIGLMGIIYRAEKRFFLLEPDSVLMIVGYGLGMWLLFWVSE